VTDVAVTKREERDDSFTFEVVVNESGTPSRHVVTMSRGDYEAQGERFSSPEEFVRRCFDFLLEREPKESILERFDVRDIGRYFPEFNRDVLHPDE
jgi:hypothetical protein